MVTLNAVPSPSLLFPAEDANCFIKKQMLPALWMLGYHSPYILPEAVSSFDLDE